MPDPTYSIPEHYPRTFQTNFSHQIQQMEARFKDAGIVDPKWTAKEHVFRDLSKNNWTTNNTRFGATNARDSQVSFRKAYKQKIEAEALKFDQWDEDFLAHITHPKSEEQQALLYGYERALDDLFIEAAGADSLGGPEPHNTAQAFPSSQVVPVNYVKPGAALSITNSGLTLWKLVEARRRFLSLDVNLDREEVLLAISPDEETSLLLQAEIAPNDIWASMVADWFAQQAAGNKGAKLLGMFNVRVTNRLKTASSIRTCYAFCRSGFVMSADSVRVKMDVLPSEKHALQLAGYGVKGVARRYDERVIALPCATLS